MRTPTQSAVPAFVVAGISLLIAVVTGVEWLGKPFRPVNLVTIIGLSVLAGVSWMQAVSRVRQERSETKSPTIP
jgi:membrane protein implicated in regulation of membrane protease activity